MVKLQNGIWIWKPIQHACIYNFKALSAVWGFFDHVHLKVVISKLLIHLLKSLDAWQFV